MDDSKRARERDDAHTIFARRGQINWLFISDIASRAGWRTEQFANYQPWRESAFLGQSQKFTTTEMQEENLAEQRIDSSLHF